MRTIETAKTAVAAIVGRWQVDDLHEAHHALIDEVVRNHTKVLIFIGTQSIHTPTLSSTHDPLDYPSREKMILSHYPEVTILPIADHYSDAVWSYQLDTLVRTAAPIGEVTLYGGRDSFIKHYQGKFRTVELDALAHPSGTDIRQQVGRKVRDSADFRAGVIYCTQNQYPRVLLVVDVAVLRENPETKILQVLMGRKPGESGWRFPGGFVDREDMSLEAAARRELAEETGLDISVDSFRLVGSCPITDWRLKGQDAMMSVFFAAQLVFGKASKASDDLGEVDWFDALYMKGVPIHPSHERLVHKLQSWLEGGKSR